MVLRHIETQLFSSSVSIDLTHAPMHPFAFGAASPPQKAGCAKTRCVAQRPGTWPRGDRLIGGLGNLPSKRGQW